VTGLRKKLLLGVAVGAAVYVAFAAYSDFGRVSAQLGRFHLWLIGPALALAALNYLLRFCKWHFYLRRIGLTQVPASGSALVFLSGFTLTVTPGKLGEVVKSYLLREAYGPEVAPLARTAPIVLAERLTDLAALVVLTLTGAFTYQGGKTGIVVGGGLVAVAIAAASSRRLALAVAGLLPERLRAKALEAYDSIAVMLRPDALLLATVISIAAWFAECAAFWVVVGGFPGAGASLALCTFIYAAMTIAGALSFLPGGLGVTEAGMTALLVATATGVDTPTAFAATFVVRLCTLWFAVLVGVAALVRFERRLPAATPKLVS
jgi:glycosyltransferase 2 family protein